MTGQPAFHIYRASAGSGKTYKLATEYIALALEDPSSFYQILGVTFTNKATAEMKQRIVKLLRELIAGENNSLSNELVARIGISTSQLKERSRSLLTNILHQYGRFSIVTIDSFFHQVIRSFAREMGLQGSFSIELDSGKVIDEVIDELLANLGEEDFKKTKKWLTDFAEQRIVDGNGWDFQKDVTSLASELLKDSYKPYAEEVVRLSDDPRYFTDILNELNKIRKVYENTLENLGQQGAGIVEKAGGVSVFKYKSAGPAGFYNKLVERDYRVGSRIRESVAGADKWLSKEQSKSSEMRQIVEEKLIPITERALNFMADKSTAYNSANAVHKYFYTYGILADLSRMLQRYREDNDVMLIADLPDFLRQIIRDSDTPYIYEKVGSRFQHYLIDEFQDTSRFQWSNFKPLVKNATDEGNRSLAVGDVKQSIYRWRGGDFDLLQNVVHKDIGEYNSKHYKLDTNWRSSSDIVSFNNRLFARTSDFSKRYFSDLEPPFDQLLEKSIDAYADVQQHVRKTELPGYVRIKYIESEDWKQEALAQTIKAVENAQDKGFSLRGIAILVRGKRDGARVVEAFMDYKAEGRAKPGYKYDLVSSESLFLSNSSAVRFLISLLRWVNDQQDKISLAEWVFELRTNLRKEELPDSEVFDSAQEWEKLVPADFYDSLDQLPALPVYELIGALIRIFDLGEIAAEHVYLQGLQDAVLDFTKREKGDISTFLRWWEKTGNERAVQLSEENDAIQILTIHKAKGLEFPIVILPFLNWELDLSGNKESILWCRPVEQAPFDRMPVIPLRYAKKLQETYWATEYWTEKIQNYLDNLNLLYVALTRPEQVMIAFSDLASTKKIADVGALIYPELQQSEYWDAGNQVLDLGEFPASQRENPSGMEFKLREYASKPWRGKVSLQLKKSREMNEEIMSARLEGISLHQDLSKIRTIDDLSAIADEKRRSRLQGLIEDGGVRVFFEEVDEVKTEVPVLLPGGDMHRLDRLIKKGNQWFVIDFKSGKPRDSDRRQVKNYVSLLLKMDIVPVSGILIYLEDREVIYV